MNLEKKESKVKIRQILKHFWKGASSVRGFFIITYLLYFFVNIINISIPLYYKHFFDLLAENVDRSLLFSSLLKIIITILLFKLLAWLLWRSSDFMSTKMMSTTISKLRQNCFDYLFGHSYTFFANSFSGTLVQRVNRFSRSFEILSNSMVYQVIPLIVTITGSVVITYFITPIISLIILAWVIVFIVFTIIFYTWKIKFDLIVAEADSRTTGYLSDSITNSNAISLFTGHEHESKSFKEITNDQAKKTRFSWYLSDGVDAVQAFLIVAVEFFVFYFALKYWEQGLVTIGIFVLAQTYIIGIAHQLWSLNKIVRMIYQALADAKEMVEILETPYEIKDIPTATELKVTKGEINFKNVTFNFNETREVLSNLNLTIKAGEKVALVGASGAGKTTFIRLIMRLYELTKGCIEIDGQDIHAVTQDSLRQNISLVPQDPVLFHRTLLENIRYGRRDATDEEVKEAARLAHCDEFIENLPLKYDTFVGERGIKLSGGERQRVAIARAILKKAPILILDEATSSLDSHSEMLIQDALDNLMKDCTTIVIAHRLSTIRKMDRIIGMRDGHIVEEGTHAELANKEGGLYKKLWDLQAGGFVSGEMA